MAKTRYDGVVMHKYGVDIPVEDFKKLQHLAIEQDTTVAALIRHMVKTRVEHRS